MNQLKCEMCNSVDLVKQDGVYVCQHCGMKYSVEDAKRMMIEGTVDVSGTVKVDNSAFVEKYLLNARRAKEKTDWEEVEKYYNLVEQNAPNNIEAIFYSAYGKAMLSLVDSDYYKREQKFNVFMKSISVIDDYYDAAKSEELLPLVKGMSSDIIKMYQTKYVYNQITKGNGVTSDNSGKTRQLFINVEVQFIESLENIAEKDNKTEYYKLLMTHYSRIISNADANFGIKQAYVKKMEELNEKLARLEPGYQPIEIPKIKAPSAGGCIFGFIVFLVFFVIFLWTILN